MKRFVKKEKGITLIALIITIIVMLILVAVTINVALNGGIFTKAEDAKQKTSREIEREKLVAAIIGAYDNNGNFVKANVELPEGTAWCDKNGTLSAQGNYVLTSNNEKFYVSPTDGTVLDEEPQAKAYKAYLGDGIFIVSEDDSVYLCWEGEIIDAGETFSLKKCTLQEAKEIFENIHDKQYNYVENERLELFDSTIKCVFLFQKEGYELPIAIYYEPNNCWYYLSHDSSNGLIEITRR